MIFTKPQREVLATLAPRVAEREMVLGGGTSVAIHCGHRRSVDFGWFSSEPIPDPMGLAQQLVDTDVPLVTDSVAIGTLHGSVSGVRVTFLHAHRP